MHISDFTPRQKVRLILAHPHMVIRWALRCVPQQHAARTWLGKSDNAWIIIDAGAFDGLDSVKFASKYTKSVVYAFEPIPSLFNSLLENCSRYSNIVPVNKALVEHQGTVSIELHTFGKSAVHMHGSSSVLEPGLHETFFPEIAFGEKIKVEAITLAQFLRGLDDNRRVALHLDLQGLETMVLRGLDEEISRVDVIHVEVALIALYAGGSLWDEVRTLLESQGFVEVSARILTVYGNAIYIRQDKLTVSQKVRMLIRKTTRQQRRAFWALTPSSRLNT